MVRMAAESGTTDIVATPHANLEYRFDPSLIAERIAALRKEVGAAIRIHNGCDFHLSFDNIQDAAVNPSRYSINRGRYLLVEFSDMAIFHTTTEVFDRLMGAGLVPIITHPERNPLLQQRLPQLKQWVEMGCLMQVTAGCLLGRFGPKAKEFAKVLLDSRVVHFIASDAHNCDHRPPVLAEAREWLTRKYGAALAERLTVSNPKAVIEDTALPAAAEEPAPRKWYQSLFGRG